MPLHEGVNALGLPFWPCQGTLIEAAGSCSCRRPLYCPLIIPDIEIYKYKKSGKQIYKFCWLHTKALPWHPLTSHLIMLSLRSLLLSASPATPSCRLSPMALRILSFFSSYSLLLASPCMHAHRLMTATAC